MKPIVYLDMDGVLADFEGKCVELVGPNWKLEMQKPFWGRISEFPNLYELLNPLPGAVELYKECVEIIGDKNQVRVLTALPRRASDSFPNAAQHKIIWAHNHIDPSLRVYFGPFAVDKQHHARHIHDILIDDMYINCKQWRARGAFAIEHKNVQDTIMKLRQFWPNRHLHQMGS